MISRPTSKSMNRSQLHDDQHTLRNKMAIIMGSVDIILFHAETFSAEVVEDLHRIRRSAQDALEAVNALDGNSD